MAADPKGPIDYPVAGLHPDRFESLVFLLARSTDPRVVPIRSNDHGLDARLPDEAGRTLRGWQAKRFTDGIHWEQCRKSVRRALAFWRPPRITFCFAHDLSGGEQEQFRTELAEHFPEVRLDFWPEAELQRLIRDTDEGQRAAAWLFENPEATREAMLRAMAVGGELQDTRQAAQRQAVVQKFMDRDPHVHYTTVSRSPGGPETPPADQTFLSVTLVEDGQEVRYDASARYPGALEHLGARPRLAFTDDEAGERARKAVDRLMREGGRTTIGSGLGTVIDAIPIGLQGLMPEEGLWGEVELIAADEPVEAAPVEFRQPVLVRCGETDLGMVLVERDSPAGWAYTIGGATGGLEIFLSLNEEGGTPTTQPHWRFTRGEGSAREQLLACRIMRAALEREPIHLLRPEGGDPLATAVIAPPDDVADWQAELESLESFLGYVAEVEAWLGRELFPPARPTQDDVDAIAAIVQMTRKPEAEITWRRIEMAPGAVTPDDEEPRAITALQPLHAVLFGEKHYVGMEMIYLPEARFEQAGDRVAVIPIADSGQGTSRLHHPEEVPPEAAEPPRGGPVAKVGRNDPCPCGSGKKYKKCHGG